MSDNVTVAGATIATDEVTIDSVVAQVQRVKPGFGASGAYDGDVSHVLPLPVAAYAGTTYVQNGTTQLTPQFAVINLTATGTLVAAVTAKKIRVLALFMTLECQTGDETYTFKSGAAGTAITGALCDAAAAGAVIPICLGFNPVGYFETAAGALLELALAGTSPNAQGSLVYVAV